MAISSATTGGMIASASSEPLGWRAQDLPGARFVSAGRERTAFVEGSILLPQHAVMVTLRGGAARHEIRSACGVASDGPDRAGLVSYLPAGCERRLRLTQVRWRWAGLLIAPQMMERVCGGRAPPPFANQDDPFLFGLLAELDRLHALDGGLDETYGETMVLALSHYLAGLGRRERVACGQPLAGWKLARVREHVEAGLGGPIRIADLAGLAGLSEGHFHRAFRATTGQTPLQFINTRRIERAKRLLSAGEIDISGIAARVGFVSPSHFARLFRAATGQSPSAFRRELGLD